MNKAKISIITATALVLGYILIAILTHYTSANGYYSSVEQLREREELYESATLIYSQETLDRYYDFIIDKDDNYCVIQVYKKSTWLGQKYNVGPWSTKPMSNLIRDDVLLYNSSETPDFTWSPYFFNKPKVNLLHCVAHGDSVIGDETVTTVPFTYGGKEYLLCLKFEVD